MFLYKKKHTHNIIIYSIIILLVYQYEGIRGYGDDGPVSSYADIVDFVVDTRGGLRTNASLAAKSSLPIGIHDNIIL